METHHHTRFFKTIIFILLAINILTIGFIAFQSSRRGLPEAGEFLCKELKFDAKQVSEFEKLKRQHHEQVMALKEKNKKNHDAFFQLMGLTNDSTKISAAADSVVALQKQIELATFYHFQAVRKICTPAQQKRFDEIIEQALKMLGARPPRRKE